MPIGKVVVNQVEWHKGQSPHRVEEHDRRLTQFPCRDLRRNHIGEHWAPWREEAQEELSNANTDDVLGEKAENEDSYSQKLNTLAEQHSKPPPVFVANPGKNEHSDQASCRKRRLNHNSLVLASAIQLMRVSGSKFVSYFTLGYFFTSHSFGGLHSLALENRVHKNKCSNHACECYLHPDQAVYEQYVALVSIGCPLGQSSQMSPDDIVLKGILLRFGDNWDGFGAGRREVLL